MSRKNTFQSQIATAQSLAASFNSIVSDVRNSDNLSYQINVTTSNSTGSFALQGSDDYKIDETTNTVINAGTWVSLPLGSSGGGSPSVAAANDTIVIAINQFPFLAMRLAYTSVVAGTGTCNIYLMGRQIGG